MTRSITPVFLDGSRDSEYVCAHQWNNNFFVQAGHMVTRKDRDLPGTTKFFEVFLHSPRTYIRGEGETIAKAEASCWRQYQQQQACPSHEFDNDGKCKHCGMTKFNMLRSQPCRVCSAPTFYTRDTEDNYYCEQHARDMPLSLWLDSTWDYAYLLNTIESLTSQRRKDERMVAEKLRVESATNGTFDGNPYRVTILGNVWSIFVATPAGLLIYQDSQDYREHADSIQIRTFVRAQFFQFMRREVIMRRGGT